MRNKKVFIGLVVSLTIVLISGLVYASQNIPNSSQDLKTFKQIKGSVELDGFAEKKVADIRLKDNSKKDILNFKKAEETKGYVPENILSNAGGKYVLTKLMTYEECFNNKYTNSIEHDIDPNRMVWVYQIQYNKDIEFEPGKTIIKPLITNVFDAETGEQISFYWQAGKN